MVRSKGALVVFVAGVIFACGAATATAKPVHVRPGTYSGQNAQNGNGLSFYVAPGGRRILNINVPLVGLSCAPGSLGASDHLGIASATIKRNGAFTAKAKQTGVFGLSPARFNYAFSGHMQRAKGSGSFRMTVKYDDGVSRTCTSNRITWTATRDSQPNKLKARPSGSYSGQNPQNGNGLSFYVATNRKRLLNVLVPLVQLRCAPGGPGVSDHVVIPEIAIKKSGAFGGRASQPGVLGGSPATFTYTFKGNFEGLNSAGQGRAAGMFRVDVAYNDGVSHACSSNLQSWSAARDAQPAQHNTVTAGTYKGQNSQNGNGVSFVAADATHLNSITIPVLGLSCAPAGPGLAGQLIIGNAAVTAGAFTAMATDVRTIAGRQVTFRYTFRGNFESLNSAGVPRAAGSYRVDATYNDGVGRTCSSNPQFWSATRSP
jgi:hypothetical protein